MEKFGFITYLFFMTSWFLHLAFRFSFLGSIRFDLMLVMILFLITFTQSKDLVDQVPQDECSRKLKILIIAILLMTPFAQFPGSVLHLGAENFIKAVVFYYFTVTFVNSRERLIVFISTFVFCQTFRILEPLYLHITQGYWGSFASMANWEYLQRLSGAPSDIINPNGLAFVIITVLPFFICLYKINTFWKVFTLAVTPAALYALMLTSSRSGFIGVVIIVLFLFYKSNNKVLYLICVLIGAVVLFSKMDAGQKDRYASIVDSDTKNAETSKGRIDGLIADFKVGMRRPIFGHGLGTSMEANGAYGTHYQPSHNLYIEVFQELGIVGLVFFLRYLWAVFKGLFTKQAEMDEMTEVDSLEHIKTALATLAVTTLLFGFASYGLSSYEWYLIGGLTVVINKLLLEETSEGKLGEVMS